jgi:TIR domain
MYKYKALFSYKRHPLTDEWHGELMVRIQFWLSQELGVQDAPIFFDSRSIGNGLAFDKVISDALKQSTVIISVMSPLYFTSAHCRAEIGTFIEREDHLGQNRGSLISCARFHDGASYPIPFSKMQAEDFAEFANPASAFWNSPAGVAFQPRIRAFAGAIAEKIKAAPDWDNSFPDPPFDPNGGPLPERIKRPAAVLAAGDA